MIQLERRPTDSRLQQANHESISLEVQSQLNQRDDSLSNQADWLQL
jgi:hypothetical protein